MTLKKQEFHMTINILNKKQLNNISKIHRAEHKKMQRISVMHKRTWEKAFTSIWDDTKEEQPPKQIYSLRGKFKGKQYEEISRDIKYLQSFLTKILRNNGTGFIVRI